MLLRSGVQIVGDWEVGWPRKAGSERELARKDTAENHCTVLLASVYKSVPITERVILRINLDAFNVLNQPGIGLPGGDGIISLRTSAQGARTLQYTARLTW